MPYFCAALKTEGTLWAFNNYSHFFCMLLSRSEYETQKVNLTSLCCFPESSRKKGYGCSCGSSFHLLISFE